MERTGRNHDGAETGESPADDLPSGREAEDAVEREEDRMDELVEDVREAQEKVERTD
jgi:hypothetical protein